ncbi:26S proteasome regulatory subunit 7, partial [Ascosphaera acerosa]
MPSATGANWEKYRKNYADDEEPEKKIVPLTDEYAISLPDPDDPAAVPPCTNLPVLTPCSDIQVLKNYGAAPYAAELKKLEKQIKDTENNVNEKIGIKESDTGLAPPHLWDISADRARMSEEQPLQVARCTKILPDETGGEKTRYVISVRQIAKFVVGLGDRVSPTDIEEGMRVG